MVNTVLATVIFSKGLKNLDPEERRNAKMITINGRKTLALEIPDPPLRGRNFLPREDGTTLADRIKRMDDVFDMSGESGRLIRKAYPGLVENTWIAEETNPDNNGSTYQPSTNGFQLVKLRGPEPGRTMGDVHATGVHEVFAHGIQNREPELFPLDMETPYRARVRESFARALANRATVGDDKRNALAVEAEFYKELARGHDMEGLAHPAYMPAVYEEAPIPISRPPEDVRQASKAGDTKGWTWEKYRWNPEAKGGQKIDPKNIKGTGITFDSKKDRLTVPKGREKDFEAYMDKLASPPKTVVLDNGQEVPVKSFLVPRDWRTNTEYDKDYDYVAAFLGGVEPSPVDHGKDGWFLHMNDIGKMPTHPTFSKDSYYARDPKYAPLAGEWKGETYIPGEAERSVRQAADAGDTEGPEAPVEEPMPQPTEPVPEGGPRIVINPEVFEDKRDALCVAMNEAFRVLMEVDGFNPVSEPTDAQRQFFADTAYSQNENQMRRTILARICTFDTSVKDPTEEQLEESVEFLEAVMEMGAPQNEWEQQAVQRIHDVLVAAIEKGTSVGDTPTEEPPAPEDVQEGDPRGEQAAVGGGVSDKDLDKIGQGKGGHFQNQRGQTVAAWNNTARDSAGRVVRRAPTQQTNNAAGQAGGDPTKPSEEPNEFVLYNQDSSIVENDTHSQGERETFLKERGGGGHGASEGRDYGPVNRATYKTSRRRCSPVWLH